MEAAVEASLYIYICIYIGIQMHVYAYMFVEGSPENRNDGLMVFVTMYELVGNIFCIKI